MARTEEHWTAQAPIYGRSIPLVLALGAFVLTPIVGLLVAFNQPSGLFESPGVDWYRLGILFGKTIALAAIVSISACTIGTWLALVQTRFDLVGRKILSLLSLAPLALPSYVLAAILREALAPRGLIGSIFGCQTPFTGFWAAVFVLTISCTPYAMLLVSSALARCPIQEEQAARGLGANGWTVFRDVLLPRLRGALMYSVLLITLYVVSDFGAVAVLDCDVLTWVLYTERNSRVVFEIGLLLLVAVLPLVAGIRWLRADEVSEYALDFNQITRRSLNVPSAIGSYLLYTMMAGVGAVFPAAVLIQWIVEGYTQSIEFISLLEPWVTTALYAVLASLLTVSIAIWVCWRIYRGAANRALLDTLVYLPSSLPGVLIGVGLLQLVLGIKRSSSAAADVFGYFEMTGGILLVAYSMRFLAQAYAALRPGFNRLDPQVDEAARSLGASELTIWRAIRIPGLAPSLAVALALTFLSVCKELPITLSLIPLEQKTLAYVIFDAQGEGALPDVGLASFCLLTMILVMQACTQYWRRIYG